MPKIKLKGGYMPNTTNADRSADNSRHYPGQRSGNAGLLAHAPLMLSILIGACSYAYGYGSLNARQVEQDKRLENVEIEQKVFTSQVNAMSTFDYRINQNSQMIGQFLSGMEGVAKIQVDMNKQLAEINTRQGMILKQLERK